MLKTKILRKLYLKFLQHPYWNEFWQVSKFSDLSVFLFSLFRIFRLSEYNFWVYKVQELGNLVFVYILYFWFLRISGALPTKVFEFVSPSLGKGTILGQPVPSLRNWSVNKDILFVSNIQCTLVIALGDRSSLVSV